MSQQALADWRDATAYPSDPLAAADQRFRDLDRLGGLDVHLLRLALWRWEFLRRLEEYRQDLQRLNHTVASSEKYRLAYCFPDPALPRPYPLWFEDMLGHVSRDAPIGRVLFDLSLPLGPQLRFAKRFLEAGAKTYRKRHPSTEFDKGFDRWPPQKKWPLFLRVLDARAARVSFKIIGQKLLAVERYDAAAAIAKKTHNSAIRLQKSLIRVRKSAKEPFTFKAEA